MYVGTYQRNASKGPVAHNGDLIGRDITDCNSGAFWNRTALPSLQAYIAIKAVKGRERGNNWRVGEQRSRLTGKGWLTTYMKPIVDYFIHISCHRRNPKAGTGCEHRRGSDLRIKSHWSIWIELSF